MNWRRSVLFQAFAAFPNIVSSVVLRGSTKIADDAVCGYRCWAYLLVVSGVNGVHQALPAARSSAALAIEPATSPATSEIKPRRCLRSIDPPGATWSVSATMAPT
jgi:hypothetical protein